MTRGGQTYYYHTNAHGGVLALTNANGDVVASYTYDPWGAPTSATGTVENPYRYAGYRFDSATGLYYPLNRYYSPESCRFITRDLLAGDTKQPATMNHYAYCLDDPVNRVDPSGLWTIGLTSLGEPFLSTALLLGNFSVSEYVRLSYTRMIVVDGHGNVGLLRSQTVGGGSPAVALTSQYQYTTADDIGQLAGGLSSGAAGGSATFRVEGVPVTAGAEAVCGKGYRGFNLDAGSAVGPPYEGHASATTDSTFEWRFNMFDVLGLR
jgi:RHS repeat-associated protein